MPDHPVLVTGHRGAAAHAPENTMASFQLALDAGCGAIETDVRLSADQLPVLVHDADLSRVGGAPSVVAELTAAALGRLEVGARHPDPRFHDQTVPTLADLLALCADRAQVLLDLKVVGAGAPIAQVLAETGFPTERAALIVWDDVQAEDAIRHLPRAKLLLSSDTPLATAEDDEWLAALLARGYSGLSLPWEHLTAERIERAQRFGLAVHTWTVNDPQDMLAAIAAGVDGIITDDPQRLVALCSGTATDPR
ncbi:MAG: glycerophosphodiester phosphodiesterase [Planctomycetes bacterium]|nr:glycerophosphodiester phosphodiesterase [Planctomycetota bacterium]